MKRFFVCDSVHENLGVCHRDLKVDNLLLGADGRICVGDFGSAEKMGKNGEVRHTKVGPATLWLITPAGPHGW